MELQAAKVESVDGGYLVQAYKAAAEAGSDMALEAEGRITNHLGKEHFFEKASVDIESLKSTAEEAAIVEERIQEIKAQKK